MEGKRMSKHQMGSWLFHQPESATYTREWLLDTFFTRDSFREDRETIVQIPKHKSGDVITIKRNGEEKYTQFKVNSFLSGNKKRGQQYSFICPVCNTNLFTSYVRELGHHSMCDGCKFKKDKEAAKLAEEKGRRKVEGKGDGLLPPIPVRKKPSDENTKWKKVSDEEYERQLQILNRKQEKEIKDAELHARASLSFGEIKKRKKK